MKITEVLAQFPTTAILSVDGLPFPKIGSGKVRDIFDLDDRLLIVASDRLSAFDVVLPDGIPGKGTVLTQMSLFWFRRTAGLITNHLVPDHDRVLAETLRDFPALVSRSMLVKKLRPLPVEAVVRGYLSGSGWKDYRSTGRLFGQALPVGLRESEILPNPCFTPTTKATTGHDLPMTLEQCAELLGSPLHEQVLQASQAIYRLGVEIARRAGIIVADTKFEFGLDEHGQLHLIDEVLTPDSSRFWPLDGYAPGRPQPSYDKQFVRDYLETLTWDKTPPAPPLPAEIIAGTVQRYRQALEKIVDE